ncbi:calcineurin-binding protein cabin-1-like, partial [Diaphorina citri]|uniref:Calcineurin-binding protein cabin-1-like n=1 Tax=Diaphorina citri TaxID=121845 RepID=A0A3Q0J9L4_DIACI
VNTMRKPTPGIPNPASTLTTNHSRYYGYKTGPCILQGLTIQNLRLGPLKLLNFSTGLLLFKMIEVVTEDYVKYNSRLNHDNTNFHQFLQHIDQVFYCLYGHPVSKQCVRNYIKQKYYLQSHNALGVAFTYERAKQVYFFYKTTKVAEFDTLSKNYSISLDVETMFRSIIREIPEAERPDKYIELVSSGIKRNASFSEIFSQVEPRLCEELRDIYYYIGDYHFKNKVFNKAINYYLLDICVNHNRVDAWAAMTLSQQKLIEMCLNSGDTIEEADTITSDCLWTCNSFKIILSLDSTLLPLYIEYGTFAYTIAAFSSRRIKCDSVVGVMSLEQFTALEKLKTELLATCSQNFLRATQVLHRHYKYNKIENDEKWLHLYMLGDPELNSVPFDTIQHWLVLYHIVKYEESRPDLNTSAAGTDLNISTESSPEKSSDDLYYRQSCYSTRLLFIAHEYLGKRSWCCHENGE